MAEANPVQRVKSSGVKSASIVDLLAVGFARREDDAAGTETVSRRILDRYGRLQPLGDAGPAEIASLTGLEGFEVLRAQSLIELGRRIGSASKGEPKQIECRQDVLDTLDYLRGEKREHFVAILLDAKGCIIRTATIHIGTLTASIVGPREVFREAVREGASSIIVAHNHPSGDPEPSPEDIEVTRHLVSVGRMLDIPVTDHVIIGDRRAVSLHARGYV